MAFKIDNLYANMSELNWYKGDLHIHSKASDGKNSKEEILERLVQCNFNFAALADHDIYCPGEDRKGLLIIGNSELSTRGGDVLGLFAEAKPKSRETQDVINAISSAGGLPVLAHPKIGEFTDEKTHWTYSSERLIKELSGYIGIEIYTHNVASGFQTAIDRLDAVWTYGSRNNLKPSIWGFSGSDAHSIEKILPDVGIMAAAKELTTTAIYEAICKGKFYSIAGSTARFKEISAENEILTLVVEDAKVLYLFGTPQKNISGNRRLLDIVWADRKSHIKHSYRIKGTEGYIRAEAMDKCGNYAYINPLLLNET